MRIQLGLFFLTLVLPSSFAFSAGQGIPLILDQKEEQKNTTPTFNEQNLSITPVEKTKAIVEKEFFYPYSRSISARGGLSFDSRRLQEDKTVALLFGFNYMLESANSPHKEFGVDLITQSEGHIHFSWKWLLFEHNIFRPFYKLGVLHRAVPKQEFASFAEPENYFAMVGFGFEETFELPTSLRIEIEIAQGIKSTIVNMIVGTSWGF